MENITLTEDQKLAYEYLKKGNNCFITGDAGTGKSFVLNQYLNEMKKQGKNVVITAPTGIAAINIGGVTFHRAFGYMPKPMVPASNFKYSSNRIMRAADIIVIDEAPTLRLDLFEVFCVQVFEVMKKYNKNIQIIIVGDFNQLPPVITQRDRTLIQQYIPNLGKGYIFQSYYWNMLNLKIIRLHEVVRQKDKEFVDNLELIKNGDYRGILWFNQKSFAKKIDTDSILISCTNESADNYNMSKLNAIQEQEYTFLSRTKIITSQIYDSDKANADVVKLKKGARVMSLINDKIRNCQNGSLGTIVDIIEKDDNIKVSVLIDGCSSPVDFSYHTWEIRDYTVSNDVVDEHTVATFEQIPLKLAYAITVHKSQGQTYDKCYILPNYIFTEGQLYVALSRCKSIENLSLVQEIPLNCKTADSLVLNFYNSL